MDNETLVDKDFAIEKYKLNFDYLQHIENLRLKQINIYLVIVSTLLGIVAFLISNEKTMTGPSTLQDFMPFIIFVGFSLSIYGFVMTVFFSIQKRNYDYYLSHNKMIEQTFNYPELNGISRDKSSLMKILKSAFFYWYFLSTILATIPIASIVTLKFILSKDTLSNFLACNLLLSSSPLAVFFLLLYIYIDIIKRKHKDSNNSENQTNQE